MPRIFSIKPGITFRGRKFKGLRGWAGKPLHPPLTDLPAAAYVIAPAFDVISYFKGQGDPIAHDFFVSATHVMIVGGIVSLGAAVTGFWDWWKGMEREPSSGIIGKAKRTQAWRTANWHMTIMLTVTVLVVVNVLMRLSSWDEGYTGIGLMLVSLVIAGLVSWGATYGGSLVFDYQFNVEQGYGRVWEESEEDVLPGQRS